MSDLRDIASSEEIRQAISDLQDLERESPVISVAAIHILKNELGEPRAGERRRILFDRDFVLPGGIAYRIRRHRALEERPGRLPTLGNLAGNLGAWLAGRDAERFRDRCDRYFWEEMVPVIEERFGNLAQPFMNTINEAIINYAEYSFRARALLRRVSAHIFRTEGDLAYGIVRPSGIGLRPFDPLRLTEKETGALHTMRRGWGHTLLLRRALFISFDQAPRRRGMMIVVGPDEPGGGRTSEA